jgi:hypothetical protein
MYEGRHAPVISNRAFAARLLRHAGLVLLILAGSLGGGIVGYVYLAHLSLVDAFLNAAMILGGMGPVSELQDDPAKVFAGVYALYSGVLFLVVAGILLAPVVHRIMHSLHVEESDSNETTRQRPV